MWQIIELKCPHCGKSRRHKTTHEVPVEKFDFNCCGGQEVTIRVIRHTTAFTIREVTWEVAA